jgi:hypothetical protein
MEQVGEAAGALAMGFTLMASAVAWIIGGVWALAFISDALKSDYLKVPLSPGRRVQKLIWNRWGTVERRNDWQLFDGRMQEAYDVQWDADDKDTPADAQDGCWRCHLRPEPLLLFYIARAFGLRSLPR